MLTRDTVRSTVVILLVSACMLIAVGGRHSLAAQPGTGSLRTSDNTRIALPAIDVGNGWVTQIHVQNVGHQPTAGVAEQAMSLLGG